MPYFLKYFNVKLYINTKYFGKTLERTEQAEDCRLKLFPKSEPTIRSIVKKPVNEFIINSFTGYFSNYDSGSFILIDFSF